MGVLRQFIKKAPLTQVFLGVRPEESLRLHLELLTPLNSQLITRLGMLLKTKSLAIEELSNASIPNRIARRDSLG